MTCKFLIACDFTRVKVSTGDKWKRVAVEGKKLMKKITFIEKIPVKMNTKWKENIQFENQKLLLYGRLLLTQHEKHRVKTVENSSDTLPYQNQQIIPQDISRKTCKVWIVVTTPRNVGSIKISTKYQKRNSKISKRPHFDFSNRLSSSSWSNRA